MLVYFDEDRNPFCPECAVDAMAFGKKLTGEQVPDTVFIVCKTCRFDVEEEAE